MSERIEAALTAEERWGIAANINGDSTFRNGAKIILLQIPGDPKSVEATGLSLGGRRVRKWVRAKHLKNIRPTFLAGIEAKDVYLYRSTKEEVSVIIAERFPGAPDTERETP